MQAIPVKQKGPGNAKSERLKQRGNEAFQKQDYNEAIRLYTEAIGAAPNDHVLFSNRSFAHFQLKDYRSAARDAYQCLKLDKQWSKGYYRLGLAMSGLGMYTKALEAFSVGLVGAPESADLRAGFEKARDAAAAQSLETMTWHQHPIVAASGESPKQRCTHSLTPVGSMLVCFGGFGQGLYNDVSVINGDTLTLVPDAVPQSVAKDESRSPSPRSSHTAVGYGDSVVVFGGYDGVKTFYDDVWILDAARAEWRRSSARGTPPKGRCSHTAVSFGHEMYVFGGMADEGQHFNDVAVFDMRTERWERPTIRGEAPAERNSHTMTLVGSSAVVFGGCCGAEKYYNDLHRLDLHSLTWSPISIATEDSAPAPRPRMGHAAAALGSRIYYHGGLVIEDKSYRADTHILDMESMRWVIPDLAGSVPMPRVGHAMAPLRGGKVLSYGGDGGPSLGIMKDVWIADTDLEVAQLRSGLQEGEIERLQLHESLSRLKEAVRGRDAAQDGASGSKDA